MKKKVTRTPPSSGFVDALVSKRDIQKREPAALAKALACRGPRDTWKLVGPGRVRCERISVVEVEQPPIGCVVVRCLVQGADVRIDFGYQMGRVRTGSRARPVVPLGEVFFTALCPDHGRRRALTMVDGFVDLCAEAVRDQDDEEEQDRLDAAQDKEKARLAARAEKKAARRA